ncbi:MAG: hypothetical protein WCJ30_17605 [Deltaproteobacteria bacterium]
MQDPGERGEDEAVRAVVRVELLAQVHQLRERASAVEQDGDLRRRLLGDLASRVGSIELVDAVQRLVERGRIHLGAGQQRRERVQVQTDADAPGDARLERGGAAARERIDHEVARLAELLDEVPGQRRGEHAHVRTHGVHHAAPPLGK